MPSFGTLFVLALVAGAGWYFSHQIAAKSHEVVTWFAGLFNHGLAKAVAPVPVVGVATADNLTPEQAQAKQEAISPADAVAGGIQGFGLWHLNYLRGLSQAERHQWALDCAAQDKIDPTSVETVDGVDCTVKVATLLLSIQALGVKLGKPVSFA